MPKIKTKSGAKKRFKVTGTGKGPLCPVAQAPRHDQAHQKTNPPVARHQRAVQDPWRQNQSTFCETADPRPRSPASCGG